MFPEALRAQLKIVHAYAVTPFKKDNVLELDLDGLARNLDFLVRKGVKVINVGGGTGEINALSDDELEALARVALQTVGDRALVLPTVRDNLKSAVELAPKLERLGARVFLAMPPYIRHEAPKKLEGVFDHFRILAEASGVPFLPYNTQVWPSEFFERLAEIPRIIGIKDPCQQPENLFLAIRRLGDRFVWVGNKRHQAGVLQLRMQMGLQGFTAGLINFMPEYELELFRLAQAGEWERMTEVQEHLAPFERLRDVHGDAALPKAGLDLIGLSGGHVRPPRVNISQEGRDALAEEWKKLQQRVLNIGHTT